MIVCPKCGAEAEGETTCPRCGARLPADRSAKALALASNIIGAACGAAAAAQLIIDYAQDGRFGWSLVSLVSCAAAWLLVGFPMLAYRRPALFLPVMGAVALLYLWAVELLTGGSWFLPIALPIALSAMAASTLSVGLSLRAKRRGPNIAAYVLFGGAIACLAVETVLSLNFQGYWSVTWSGIVAVAAIPTAILLLGIQKRLRPAG